MNIQTLLEKIREVKKIHEESWNEKTHNYDKPWREVLPEVMTDVVSADMAAVLIDTAWNDCEEWLNYLIAEPEKKRQLERDRKKAVEEELRKALYDRFFQSEKGEGEDERGKPITILGRAMHFNRTNDEKLWLVEYRNGGQSLLYIHEFNVKQA